MIGAGPGGYAAAFLAADLGMKVTLIDKEANPGGVCLYRGCIPSKALLHAAEILNTAEDAKAIGIDFGKPEIDAEKLRAWKDQIVRKLTSGLGQLSKQRNIEYLQGKARFLSDTVIEVTQKNVSSQLGFENAVIAAGSVISRLPGQPDSRLILDSTSALALDELPESMLIIGGGYIGLELGSVYAALGTKITVAEMLPEILSGADRDLVSVLKKNLSAKFESILTETKVLKLEEAGEKMNVELERKGGERINASYSKVLVSIGRRPDTNSLGLEDTSVILDKKGFIQTDSACRTSVKNIFAIGDIAGEPMLAHKASHEGRAAVEAIHGMKSVFDPKAIPAVVFTDPEIAWAGITETEAKEKNIDHKVMKFPWAASGRALTLGRPDGLTKIIFDSKTERIIGMGIVGPHAGELISEGVLAIEMGANATDLKLTIHPHPTLSETIMESAEMFFGQSTHIFRPKK